MKSRILILILVLLGAAIVGAVLYNAKTVNDITSDVVTIKESAVKEENKNSVDKAQAGTMDAADEKTSRILVAYFSHTGNTREMARHIQEATGGDIFEIVPAVSCPEDYDACKEIATKQKDEDARPEVATEVTNMDEYDVVFVGYPLWLSTMPMHMFTFLESYDFSGKIVIPFCTSGSGKIGESESDIATLLPKSDIRKGLVIKGDEITQANANVLEWVEGLDIEL